MKISSRWNYKSIMGKVMMGFVLAAIIGSMDVVPAIAKDDHGRVERHDNGRYEKRGRGHERDRREYRTYGYRERVYVAPPVYFAPPPPPGVSIFLPPIHIR